MTELIVYLLGGVGMFLVGMETMTGALRVAAGGRLRSVLQRFTTTPIRGVLTGLTATAIVQSSSATTVMTVGFVGAGLISMTQALGIILGANIGTTFTGWLVVLLGFKLNLSDLSMVALFPAALAGLLGRGGVARTGRIVAGLALLLIGLELMQTGTAGLSEALPADAMPGEGLGGVLLLVGIGAVLTLVMQSSSAALALALVMLDAGAIGLLQAAALVIGMNIGTTFTALLASLGGSIPMRQTAVANVIFNLVTAGLAVPLLFLLHGQLEALAIATDTLTALLVFHTGFNLMGTALFLPVTDRFADLVAQLIPDRPTDRLFTLDPALLQDGPSALLAAQSAMTKVITRLLGSIGAALAPEPDYRPMAALDPCRTAIDDLTDFLSDIRLPVGVEKLEDQYSSLLHQLDHLSRLMSRTTQTGRVPPLLSDRTLRRPALAAGAALRQADPESSDAHKCGQLGRLNALTVHRRKRHRRALLLGEHAGIYTLEDVFAHTDSMRWLDRVLHHADRLMFYHRATTMRTSTPERNSPRGN